MEKYAERVEQYKRDLAAYENGTDETIEWSVQSTAADRKAVSAELVSVECAKRSHGWL